MQARAVIGANFGDEGKGLMVDYLCATEGAGVVVRFNGGAQAGHTVVTPTGERHVFSHFGSGAFVGVPTYLSEYFICNPILFLQERARLPIHARVYAHPDCLVTTFADMLANQSAEDAREQRHGSCGVGINQTVERSKRYPIVMRNLWDDFGSMERRVSDACAFAGITVSDEGMHQFLAQCRSLATAIEPREITDFVDPVFEGAQGLLLDQNRSEYFPHLTRSNTGIQNVRRLCEKAGITRLTGYYVSRTYLTRHGAGPLPGEDPSMCFVDLTNIEHPYQGRLRFAPLDSGLTDRCARDFGALPKIVLTHCDQMPPSSAIPASLYTFGPDREAVYLTAIPY